MILLLVLFLVVEVALDIYILIVFLWHERKSKKKK